MFSQPIGNAETALLQRSTTFAVICVLVLWACIHQRRKKGSFSGISLVMMTITITHIILVIAFFIAALRFQSLYTPESLRELTKHSIYLYSGHETIFILSYVAVIWLLAIIGVNPWLGCFLALFAYPSIVIFSGIGIDNARNMERGKSKIVLNCLAYSLLAAVLIAMLYRWYIIMDRQIAYLPTIFNVR